MTSRFLVWFFQVLLVIVILDDLTSFLDQQHQSQHIMTASAHSISRDPPSSRMSLDNGEHTVRGHPQNGHLPLPEQSSGIVARSSRSIKERYDYITESSTATSYYSPSTSYGIGKYRENDIVQYDEHAATSSSSPDEYRKNSSTYNDQDGISTDNIIMNISMENTTDVIVTTNVAENPHGITIQTISCNPCIIWQSPLEDNSKEQPNLTIIPMGGIFMFIVYLSIKFLHWCNEDIRLADERFMKISVPAFESPTESPMITHVRHHPNFRGVHHHRRSSISVLLSTKINRNAQHGVGEGNDSNDNGSDSEEITVVYNENYQKPVPSAAAASKSFPRRSLSQRMSFTRSPNRYLRRQSMHSSNTTLSSSFSSRSPSVRTNAISFHDSKAESSSPSSSMVSQGTNADSYLDVTPLIRHSASAETTPYGQRKMSFHTHLLTPPLLHFQVSSMHTSTTSLGESIPSISSKPGSVCDSALTEALIVSEDNDSSFNEDNGSKHSGGAGAGPSDGKTSSEEIRDDQPERHHRHFQRQNHNQERPKSGMMFLSGSYYEDPLIIECSYMEVDETHSPRSDPNVFTCGSRTSSTESMKGAHGLHQHPLQQQRSIEMTPLGEEPINEVDSEESEPDEHSEMLAEHVLADIHIDASMLNGGSDISDCNSESGLTGENHEDDADEELTKGSETTSYCSSPGIYHGMDPSVYYKLSVESNASTGSLQSPESIQSDSTSVCSNEMALVRRITPGTNALRWLNHRPHPPRRERVSLNGVTYFSQHGGRRIQNGKVMRMCRSWCVGDKASAIYGQLRRGMLEKECYM